MLKVLASSSRGNCYILSTSKEQLIIECGIKYKRILEGLNYDISKVVGCLVTHEHLDHAKSVGELADNGIDVYASKGTFDKLFRGDYKHHRLKIVKSEGVTVIGGFKILPFDVQHDAEEPLGFLIQHEEIGKMLFLTDTYYCKYTFKGLNHILIECNYSKDILDTEGVPNSLRKRIMQSHYELGNAIEFLKSCDLKNIENIMLIHISDVNSNKNAFKEEVEKNIGLPVTIAERGVEI